MDTFTEIIDAGGPKPDLAAALGLKVRAIYAMRSRDYVAPRHWRKLQQHLQRRGVIVYFSDMVSAAERRPCGGASP